MNEKTSNNNEPTGKQTQLAKRLAKKYGVKINGDLEKNPDLQMSIIKEFKPQENVTNLEKALFDMREIRQNPELAKDYAKGLAEKGAGKLDKNGNLEINYGNISSNYKALDGLNAVQISALKELTHLETARDLDRDSPPKSAGMAYIEKYIERGDAVFRIELKEHDRGKYLRQELKKNKEQVAEFAKSQGKGVRKTSFTKALANEQGKQKGAER